MKPGHLIEGKGSRVVAVACAALVRVHCSTPYFSIVDKRFIRTEMFRLPDGIDSFEIVAEGKDPNWVVEWWPIKPGYEIPDPTPVALPIGAHKPESLEQTISRMVRLQVSQAARSEGYDPEEEEDFEDDDAEFDEVPTQYEFEEQGRIAEEEQRRFDKLRKFFDDRAKNKARRHPPAEPAASPVPPKSDPAKTGTDG